MNKREFTAALRKSLAVLGEKELQDIVNEYEQHIDMKMAEGLTEAEAIEDFGDFQELISEILEAYQVDADTETESPKAEESAGEQFIGGIRNTGAGLIGIIGNAAGWLIRSAKGLALWLWEILKMIGAWLSRALKWLWRQIRRPFVWLFARSRERDGEGETAAPEGAGQAGAEEGGYDGRPARGPSADAAYAEQPGETGYEARTGKPAGRGRSAGPAGRPEKREARASGAGFWRKLTGGIAAVVRGCVSICLSVIRWCWNAGCAGASLLIGIVGMFFLFALGMLAVLLLNGYPLAGLTICCLGAAVCLFALAAFALTLIWRKKQVNLNMPAPADSAGVRAEGRSAERPYAPEIPVSAGETAWSADWSCEPGGPVPAGGTVRSAERPYIPEKEPRSAAGEKEAERHA